MSDIERAAFEQAVADKWSDSYIFKRFGDEDYCDEVLEGMWFGWQASRQLLNSSEMACIKTLVDIRFACGDNSKRMQDELVEYIAELSRQALEGEPVGTARRCGYDRDITYCDFEADKVPIGTKLYTHPASSDEWIKRSEGDE